MLVYLSNDSVAFRPNERDDVFHAEYGLGLCADLYSSYEIRIRACDVSQSEKATELLTDHPNLIYLYYTWLEFTLIEIQNRIIKLNKQG